MAKYIRFAFLIFKIILSLWRAKSELDFAGEEKKREIGDLFSPS